MSPHQAWDRFWFQESDPRNLAAARIIVALHALWYLLSRDFAALSGLPAALWPSGNALAWRFLLFPGMGVLERIVEIAAFMALVMVALGVAVRGMALVSALTLYHLGPLQSVLATPDPINRGFTIATLCLVVLAVSPCTDRWSLSRRDAIADPWQYSWPLRLMQLLVAEIYLFGLAGKLRVSGLAWFSAENLRRNLVLYSHMHPEHSDSLVSALALRPMLLQAAAAGVLLLEGGFVVAVFSRRARRVLIPAALAMHLSILRTMGIVFANMVHLGLFVNWSWAADRLRGAATPPQG